MHYLLKTIVLFALVVGMSGLPLSGQSPTADQVFAQLDTDKDGNLSQTEFGAHPDLQGEKFADWDANRDGSLSKGEFAAKFGQK